MNKKKQNLFENRWFIRIISLLASILLFSYVFSENYGLTTTNRNNAISTTRNETISNLPIQVNMDTDRYFISGLPETVVLSLSGPESVIVQTLSANDFSIVTEDLNLLGSGRHTIEIKVVNLSDELNYQITPSRVNVEIEEKVSIESPVEVSFDTSLVDEEYVSGEAVLNDDTVIVTGPSSTIDRIERIYVKVPTDINLTSDVDITTVVQVEDGNGNKLNVSVEPQEIDVKIPIEPYQKKVPLKVTQTGTPASGRTYELSVIGDGEVALIGNRNLLAEVDEVPIEIDISNIRTDTVVTVPITSPLPTVTVSPIEVQVNVKVETTQTESAANRSSTRVQTINKKEEDD